MVLAPDKAYIGPADLRGNNTPAAILMRDMKSPKGSHKNMAREEQKVGLKANLPS